MCYQVIELFSACQCLYYQHAVDRCAAYGQPGHYIQGRTIFVGEACSDHLDKFNEQIGRVPSAPAKQSPRGTTTMAHAPSIIRRLSGALFRTSTPRSPVGSPGADTETAGALRDRLLYVEQMVLTYKDRVRQYLSDKSPKDHPSIYTVHIEDEHTSQTVTGVLAHVRGWDVVRRLDDDTVHGIALFLAANVAGYDKLAALVRGAKYSSHATPHFDGYWVSLDCATRFAEENGMLGLIIMDTLLTPRSALDIAALSAAASSWHKTGARRRSVTRSTSALSPPTSPVNSAPGGRQPSSEDGHAGRRRPKKEVRGSAAPKAMDALLPLPGYPQPPTAAKSGRKVEESLRAESFRRRAVAAHIASQHALERRFGVFGLGISPRPPSSTGSTARSDRPPDLPHESPPAGPATDSRTFRPPGQASTGTWTPTQDLILIDARARSLGWAAIQREFFPGKTKDACHRRWETLMTRSNADDFWNARRLEILAKNYLASPSMNAGPTKQPVTEPAETCRTRPGEPIEAKGTFDKPSASAEQAPTVATMTLPRRFNRAASLRRAGWQDEEKEQEQKESMVLDTEPTTRNIDIKRRETEPPNEAEPAVQLPKPKLPSSADTPGTIPVELGTNTISESSSSYGSTTSDSSSSSTQSESVPLSRQDQKRVLVDRLMRYFYSLLQSCRASPASSFTQAAYEAGCRGEAAATPSSSSSLSTKGKQQQSTASSTEELPPRLTSQRRKRALEGEDDGDDEGEGPDEKIPRLDENSPDTLCKRLACPYFKKDPERYQLWRSCIGPGWMTVHRVKEHLYRTHALPITCPRCHLKFKSEPEKDIHLVADARCELVEQTPAEGVDATTRELLRCRKKTHKRMTEVEKWREAYLILFPETDPDAVPSPYYDYLNSTSSDGPGSPSSSELTRYEQFLRRELPTRVRHQLEIRIEEALHPVEESLRSQLIEIVRDMQLELFEIYKENRTDAESSGSKPRPDQERQQQVVDLAEAEGFEIVSRSPLDDEDPNTQATDSLEAASVILPGPSHQPQLHPTAAPMPVPADFWTWEEQLHAFRPEPYLDDTEGGGFDGFDGLLFNFDFMRGGQMGQVLEDGNDMMFSFSDASGHDSGYGSLGDRLDKGKHRDTTG